MVVVLFFLFGIVFGSFFNVVGLRVPLNIPFHIGRSSCPTCHHLLRPHELVPIISFILQKGKCRKCHSNISYLYPLIETITGLLFALGYVKMGFQPELITALFFISMCMIVVVSDFTYMLIPNKILLFFLPFFLVLRVWAPLDPVYDAILGAVVGFVLIALIILFSGGGMGAGDMKLFTVLGIVLGVKKILLTFVIASLFGAIAGIGLIAIKKMEKKQQIPFGPFIVFGSLVSYFYGEYLITLYLILF